jgi:hypothetical protein
MAYSFFPNDFQNLPNLQDQLFLMKQKQAATLNEYYYPGKKETQPRDIARENEAIRKFMKPGLDYTPQPKLLSTAGTVLPSPTKKLKPPADQGFVPRPDHVKYEGGLAGGLGIPQEAPRKPGRGVTKSGKMITITDPGYTNTSGMIDGSGRRNVNRDKDGNVQITYGISGPPEGMSSSGEDYVSVGDDFDDKTSNPTEYYNTKSKQREADRASFNQSLSRSNKSKPYIQ